MNLKPFSILLLSTVFSLPAHAIDFDNYQPTLGADSGYSLTFTEVSQGNETFVYYTRNADDSLTPVYYKIGDPVKNNSATFLSRIDTDQGGADIDGNFWGLVDTTGEGGGATYNEGGSVGNIIGDFIGNSSSYFGGAIYNDGGTIGDIIGDFIDNSASAGGAIYNESGTIGNIIGDFIGNNASMGYGGAIYNEYGDTIGNITGDFIGNSATDGNYGNGGAIANYDTIGDITGDFIGNSAAVMGGAIENYTLIGNITGDFIGNKARTGGAIYNGRNNAYNGGTIGDIKGDFIGNSASNSASSNGETIYSGNGGAIYKSEQGSIGNITGDFIGNSAREGGAIFIEPSRRMNFYFGDIGNITGNFIGNSATRYGGAIATGYFGGPYVGSTYVYYNLTFSGSFIGNHAGIRGGAISAFRNSLTFLADGKDNFFTGNYMGTKGSGEIYNAIYTEGGISLTFTTKAKGNFIFDDNIDSDARYPGYSLTITGDDSGKFFMNNDIIGAADINVSDTMLIFGEGPYGNGRILASASPVGEGIIKPADAMPSVTNLSLTNAQFYLHNNYYETVSVKNYTAAGDTLLHINVGKVNGDWTSDVLHVDGNLLGETKVVVYAGSKDTDLESVLFVDAPNDVEKIRNAFSVYRVYGSPYKWTAKGEHTNGSQWYLTMGNEDNEYKDLTPAPITTPQAPELPELPDVDPTEPNPDPEPEIELNPEVMAFRALQVAAIEQTRSMVTNVRNKVSANKVLPDTCLLVVDDNELNHNAWVNPIYHTANIDTPVEIEADIWGLEAGFDLQTNRNNKFGIFASYRQGEYDLNGKGEEYFSEVGSQIDIDSYIAGLYYRYDYRHLWMFATAHGGIQKADIETNDGVSSDTDGTEVGASAEMGYLFNLSNTLKLEPSLGVFYTEIDFDDAESTYGTNASWDKIRQTEVEAGVKLEKYFEGDHGFTKVYVKPSVIQVITNGDEVRITGLDKISTYEDGTLGRIELGARHAITDALSAYGFVNYTFGSDYDATSLGAGLSYSW